MFWAVGLLLAFLAACAASPPVYSGINFIDGEWSPDRYNSTRAEQSLAHLVNSTRSSSLSLTFCWFQSSLNEPGPVYPVPGVSATDEEVIAVAKLAHALGLSVLMRPCVNLDGRVPNNTGWRGDIGRHFNQSQWVQWFQSYTAFIVHVAELAQQAGVEVLSVGLELKASTPQASLWRGLIASVRAVYSGPLVYGCTNGVESSIVWWDALDFIGIDAYYPLDATTVTPSVSQLVTAWDPIISSLAALSAKFNKSIMFTEIGYCAKFGANITPSLCSKLEYNEQAQADLYTAFFLAVYPQPWFRGVYFWAWLTNPDDTGRPASAFSPAGRPAADVMATYFGHR